MLIPAALSLRQQRHGVHTAQGRLRPLPISIPYSAPASQQPGSLPLPPPVGPYPSRCPCGRAAGGSCGGPRCAGSSPRVRRWSRGTACRCSGPACAPTRCGCWRSALQGRARREAQRSPPPPRHGSRAGCRVLGAMARDGCHGARISRRQRGQETPHSEPRIHWRFPSQWKNAKCGSRERGCAPPGPDIPLLVTSPHGAKDSSFQPCLGAGGTGEDSSPSSSSSSFSCCFCPQNQAGCFLGAHSQ